MSSIIIPKTDGRGAGLGNEIIVWSKSFLAAQAIEGRPMPPAFGFNLRPYWKYFKRPRYDWLLYQALGKLSPVSNTFTNQDYLANYDPDFGVAFGKWHKSLGKTPKILFVEGLFGGYHSIYRARHFILGRLLGTKHTAENIAAKLPPSSAKVPLRIGIHYRSGDFGPEWTITDVKRWNRRLPMKWYQGAMRAFVKCLGRDVEFVLVTDASREEAAPFIEEFNPVTTFDQQHTMISDMLLLSTCDVVIPSLSSFSFSSIMLGDALYIWPFEHALKMDGWLSLWGNREEDDASNLLEMEIHKPLYMQAMQPVKSRCQYFSEEKGLGDSFLMTLVERHERKQPFSDPMMNGVARVDSV